MKKLLFLTDFSAHATHAAEYGYDLAQKIHANVLLCNIVIIPAETPHSAMLVWPMDDHDSLIDGSIEQLKTLMNHLTAQRNKKGFEPIVHIINEEGYVTDRVGAIVDANRIDMIVMGTHGSSGLSTLMLGNHARNMIDSTTKPLLLIPDTAKIKPVKKIAYATDFTNKKEDMAAIFTLVELAKDLNAEILITHIQDEASSKEFKKWLDELLTEVSNKANYPGIYYRIVKKIDAQYGLDWLCEHGQIDMLAMLHRPHGILSSVFTGSHTQKIAKHIEIPLLVIPACVVNTIDQ